MAASTPAWRATAVATSTQRTPPSSSHHCCRSKYAASSTLNQALPIDSRSALWLAQLATSSSGGRPPAFPLSTYRLQFHRGFTFRDARAIVDYLHDLGISDCYASSYLKAVPGSPHGYDVADPTQPQSGDRHRRRLRRRGSRRCARAAWATCMDLVPNHMGIAKSANPWWLDVLENGA